MSAQPRERTGAGTARLSCPRCELVVPPARRGEQLEHCPRCLARTSGALSIRLEPTRERSRGADPRELIARLARTVRAARER